MRVFCLVALTMCIVVLSYFIFFDYNREDNWVSVSNSTNSVTEICNPSLISEAHSFFVRADNDNAPLSFEINTKMEHVSRAWSMTKDEIRRELNKHLTSKTKIQFSKTGLSEVSEKGNIYHFLDISNPSKGNVVLVIDVKSNESKLIESRETLDGEFEFLIDYKEDQVFKLTYDIAAGEYWFETSSGITSSRISGFVDYYPNKSVFSKNGLFFLSFSDSRDVTINHLNDDGEDVLLEDKKIIDFKKMDDLIAVFFEDLTFDLYKIQQNMKLEPVLKGVKGTDVIKHENNGKIEGFYVYIQGAFSSFYTLLNDEFVHSCDKGEEIKEVFLKYSPSKTCDDCMYHLIKTSHNSEKLIIYIHGGPFSKAGFRYDKLQAKAGDDFDYIFINYPGSTLANIGPLEQFKFSNYRNLVSEIVDLISIEQKNYEQVHLVGGSFGGFLVNEINCDDLNAEKISIIRVNGIYGYSKVKELFEEAEVRNSYLSHTLQSEKLLPEETNSAPNGQLGGGTRCDFFIHGTEDIVVPVSDVKVYAKDLIENPDNTFIFVENSGHVLDDAMTAEIIGVINR